MCVGTASAGEIQRFGVSPDEPITRSPTVIVTVFRSRLRPEALEEYVALSREVSELASRMPGYVSHKTFVAEDGERATIVEFESEEAQAVWKALPRHVEAQKKGRADFYSEYSIQVCELKRSHAFTFEEAGAVGSRSFVPPGNDG